MPERTFVLHRERLLIATGRADVGRLLLVGPARLTLAGVQQLEDARYFFGIGPYNVTLCYRADMEHFAANTATRTGKDVCVSRKKRLTPTPT